MMWFCRIAGRARTLVLARAHEESARTSNRTLPHSLPEGFKRRRRKQKASLRAKGTRDSPSASRHKKTKNNDGSSDCLSAVRHLERAEGTLRHPFRRDVHPARGSVFSQGKRHLQDNRYVVDSEGPSGAGRGKEMDLSPPPKKKFTNLASLPHLSISQLA